MSHRVFLSSTFDDLKDYRRAVRDGIHKLGASEVSMETFGARDESPSSACERLAQEESDLFVGIYAYRYGYIPDGADISILELEYKAASLVSLPRFIYILDENQPWLKEHMDRGASEEKLAAFKATLLKRHICEKFSNRDQLATMVVADVGRHMAMQSATKVGPDIDLPDIGLESLRGPSGTPDEWNVRRNEIYNANRNLFLTHIIRPSSKPGQKFDVFIYLIRHSYKHYKADDFSDIRVAEFFLGRHWRNRVFPAVVHNGFIGISTAAYGTFLCICRVTFIDGTDIYLQRYIDFEAQRTGGAAV
jgi:hypothetical protein